MTNKKYYTFSAGSRKLKIPMSRKLKIDKLINDYYTYKINGDEYVAKVDILPKNQKAYWQLTELGCLDGIFED